MYKKSLSILTALLLIIGIAMADTLKVDPIAAEEIYETENAQIISMDILRMTEEVLASAKYNIALSENAASSELQLYNESTKSIAIKEIKERGIIRIGTTGDYCPMSFLNPETGKYEGFDADLAEDLAASLGVKIEFVPTSWPTLMIDTLAEKFDLAICGITITEARLEAALMSNGYLANGKTILVRAEDVGKYQTLADINRPDVVVMENPGGTNEKFARANLPDAKIIIHNVNEEIPALIAEGKADVMITEMAEAGYYAKRDKRLAAPLITRPFSSGKIGVLMNKNSSELLDFVNSFLEENSDRLNELRHKYIYME